MSEKSLTKEVFTTTRRKKSNNEIVTKAVQTASKLLRPFQTQDKENSFPSKKEILWNDWTSLSSLFTDCTFIIIIIFIFFFITFWFIQSCLTPELRGKERQTRETLIQPVNCKKIKQLV